MRILWSRNILNMGTEGAYPYRLSNSTTAWQTLVLGGPEGSSIVNSAVAALWQGAGYTDSVAYMYQLTASVGDAGYMVPTQIGVAGGLCMGIPPYPDVVTTPPGQAWLSMRVASEPSGTMLQTWTVAGIELPETHVYGPLAAVPATDDRLELQYKANGWGVPGNPPWYVHTGYWVLFSATWSISKVEW